MSKKHYWILFGAVQIVGLIAPGSASMHTNPLPLLVGIVLCFPGSLLVAVIPHLNDFFAYVVAVAINAAAWYLLWKLLRLRD